MSKDRHKQQKRREQDRKARQHEIEAHRRNLQNLADELSTPYEQRYRDIVAEALAACPDLLGIYECGDDVFYSEDRSALLKHAGLGHWTRVMLQAADGLDISDSPPPRPSGESATGCTSIVTDGAVRRYAVFMRATVAGDGQPITNAAYAFKIAALLHELGHVRDLERQINYDATAETLDLVKAEVFAHRHACEEMARRNLRYPLKHFLLHLEEAANGHPGEYARLAAQGVVQSPHFARYKAAVRDVP